MYGGIDYDINTVLYTNPKVCTSTRSLDSNRFTLKHRETTASRVRRLRR